jgi:hypothetical protein
MVHTVRFTRHAQKKFSVLAVHGFVLLCPCSFPSVSREMGCPSDLLRFAGMPEHGLAGCNGFAHD